MQGRVQHTDVEGDSRGIDSEEKPSLLPSHTSAQALESVRRGVQGIVQHTSVETSKSIDIGESSAVRLNPALLFLIHARKLGKPWEEVCKEASVKRSQGQSQAFMYMKTR